MSTPSDTENLRARFSIIMQKHRLTPDKVRRENSCIAFSDEGEFLCENGNHFWKWRSKFSWITFDLINLEIVYRWKMKCKHCFVPTIPTFTVDQVEAMFETVVSYYKGEPKDTNINIGYSGRRNFRQPHLPHLCEKCKYGHGDMCWYRKFDTIPRKTAVQKGSDDFIPVVRGRETVE